MILVALSGNFQQVYSNTTKSQQTTIKNPINSQQVLLDVPLENQFEGERLQNGCEVTALSMLLNYYGYGVNKNQLADQLTYQSFRTGSNQYGNPHLGFVGNIKEGRQAMGVFVEPIEELAKKVVTDEKIITSNGDLSFDKVLNQVAQGNPVWMLATVDLQVPTASDFLPWPTAEAELTVTPLIHAIVVTGFDESSQTVYLNDPYGEKIVQSVIKI
ncbi:MULTISPECIES: C39 family peptidase [Enterococcus]|uniref:C39 family peptidase n=1 Tax=Enterococcus alishanensis TaxID=1303817 RepID=A0ABS6TGD7_9ENTE|nr:C39 family peptidase [Enterococcus alishanensis]MBV7391979.1 C39 family peptidase [Enterococcus alishanensis]